MREGSSTSASSEPVPTLQFDVASREQLAHELGDQVSVDGVFLPMAGPHPAIGTAIGLRVGGSDETLIEASGHVCWTADARGGPFGTVPGVALRFDVPPAIGCDLIGELSARREARMTTGALPESLAVPLIFVTFGDPRAHMAEVASEPLRPWLEHFAHGYARVGLRNEFLWRWCVNSADATTLPSVARELRDSVVDLKVLGVMFDVLVDDIADERQDGRMLDAALRLGMPGASIDLAAFGEEDRSYLAFTTRVWEAIHVRVRSYPRYAEFRELLDYDYRQLLNTMHYAYLINRNPRMLNLWEHDLYQPHNMHILVNATVDLMCSPEFEPSELGIVRAAACTAQRMGRIGNMITTWERELNVGDFSSGVWFYAIERGLLRPDDLRADNAPAIRDRILEAGIERHFILEWERLRERLRQIRPRIRSFDLGPYVEGFETLFRNHLNSRGLK